MDELGKAECAGTWLGVPEVGVQLRNGSSPKLTQGTQHALSYPV